MSPIVRGIYHPFLQLSRFFFVVEKEDDLKVDITVNRKHDSRNARFSGSARDLPNPHVGSPALLLEADPRTGGIPPHVNRQTGVKKLPNFVCGR